MTTSPTQSPLRVIHLVKRKPSLTPEEFHAHWRNIHGPLISPLMIKHGFIEYSQIYTSPTIKSSLSAISASKAELGNTYDGYASFLVPGLENLVSLFTDLAFQDEIVKDEGLFIDGEASTLILAGGEEVFVSCGEMVREGKGL